MSGIYTSVFLRSFAPVTEIRLYDETVEHIADEHAEFQLQLPSQVAGLLHGLANPTRFHVSTTDPARAVVLVSEAFTYFDDPLHVPIRLVTGTSGRVVTAYFASGTTPGKLLWSAGDE